MIVSIRQKGTSVREKGIPFREAHDMLGKIVKFTTEQNKKLNQLTLSEYKQFSEVFDEDVFKFLSAELCLENKKTFGSPNTHMVQEQLNNWERTLI